MKDALPKVLVVDDDPSVQKALRRLFDSVGLEVATFSLAQDLLRYPLPPTPGCLVLDVRLPGQSGLELQRALAAAAVDFPVIFISGHGDVPTTVRAMKAGAVDFLTKPVSDQDLIDAVQRAIAGHAQALRKRDEEREIQKRVELLTAREAEVLKLILEGMINKQIAHELGVGEQTIKVHRAHVMEKMQAETLADLFRIAGKAGLVAVFRTKQASRVMWQLQRRTVIPSLRGIWPNPAGLLASSE